MSLKEEDIKHIADLARIDLTNKELKKYADELSAILNFVDQLKELNVKDIDPLYQAAGLVNIYREDKDPYSVKDTPIEEILKEAPSSESGLFKVKSVLNKDE